jgi:hypothetical protein
MPGPVLALVDDAQALAPGIVADLGAAVDDDHAVLLVSTERLESHNDETVADARAKEIVYEHCVANLDVVGTLLMSMDDRVGHGMTKETPLLRLTAANASSWDPWSFMFVASGGEQRISGILDRLIHDPAQVLTLGAIATAQVASRDAGVSREQIMLDIAQVEPKIFGPPGSILDRATFDMALEAVLAERIVRENGGLLRTAHIRVADRLLLDLARHKEDSVGKPSRALVRNHLLREEEPLLGKYWMVDWLGRSESLRFTWRDEWLDSATTDALVRRAMTATPGAERSLAARLLSSLGFARVLDRPKWEVIAAAVPSWLPVLTAEDVHGVSDLLGSLRNAHQDLSHQVAGTLAPEALAGLVASRGTRASASGWSTLVREIAPPHSSEARAGWQARFAGALDLDALAQWLGNTDADSRPREVYHLIDTLAAVAPEAAAAAIRACADHFRVIFETDLADASIGLADWVFGYMHYIAKLAGSVGAIDDDEVPAGAVAPRQTAQDEEPSEAAVEFAATTLQIMSRIDWSKAGASLRGRSRYEIESLDLLLGWVGWLSTDLLDDLADAIPFDWLTTLATAEYDATVASVPDVQPPSSIDTIDRHLLWLCAGPRGRARVRAQLESWIPTLSSYPFCLVDTFPDLAVAALRGVASPCSYVKQPPRRRDTRD